MIISVNHRDGRTELLTLADGPATIRGHMLSDSHGTDHFFYDDGMYDGWGGFCAGLSMEDAVARAGTIAANRHIEPALAVAAVDPPVADPGTPTPRVADPSSEPEIQVLYGDLTAREHAILQAHDWQLAHPEGNKNDAYMVIVGLLGLLPFEELSAALAKEQK